jgi:tetratricopeptide (TPR) repeat protein
VSEASAEIVLEALKARSLVLSDAEEQRFAMLPLTATYSRRYLPPDRLTRAADRLCDRAYALAQENGYQQFERFSILDAEWPTIAAAIPLFLQGDNDRLQGLCSALGDFLNFTGHWDEWLSLSLQAEEKAVAAQDVHHAVWQAYQAARVYYRHDQSAEVLACAARAEQHWAKAGAWERATSIRLRGIGHESAKDYPAAVAAYQESLNLYRALSPESEDVAAVLNDLAMTERKLGDSVAAERDYREALRIAKKINEREGVAVYTGNLVEFALAREQWAEAEQSAREALPLSEGVGRLESIATNCRRIAQACARQDRKAEGLPYAQRAVSIFTKLRSSDLAKAEAVLKECEE